MWNALMDELRELHLGVKRRTRGPSVAMQLQAAYEQVVARQKKSAASKAG
jgi:hypothetical protein